MNEFITRIGIILYTFSVQGWFPFIFCIDTTTNCYKILRVIFPHFFGLQDFVIWGSIRKRSQHIGLRSQNSPKEMSGFLLDQNPKLDFLNQSPSSSSSITRRRCSDQSSVISDHSHAR